MLIEGF